MSTLSQFVGISSTICPSSATITLVGKNVTSTSFDTSAPLGSRPNTACGFLLCKSGGVAWIVAPVSSEVARIWCCRGDAIQQANTCTGCVGVWFIPTSSQLLNPGYICRQYWDQVTNINNLPRYFSDTPAGGFQGIYVNFQNGNVGSLGYTSAGAYIRAFRCVTY